MVTEDTKATPDPDALCTTLKNKEAVLLHLGTKTYYSLNETGAYIWTMMSKGLTLGEIIRDIEAEFDVTADKAQESVIDLASQLAAAELVHLTGD